MSDSDFPFEQQNPVLVQRESFLSFRPKMWLIVFIIPMWLLSLVTGIVPAILFSILFGFTLYLILFIKSIYSFNTQTLTYRNEYRAGFTIWDEEWTPIPSASWYTVKKTTITIGGGWRSGLGSFDSSRRHPQAGPYSYGDDDYDMGLEPYQKTTWQVFVHTRKGQEFNVFEHEEKREVVHALRLALFYHDLPAYHVVRRDDRLLSKEALKQGKLALRRRS